MTTAAQLKALITSHGEGDDARFFSVAMQMAAHAARTGHSRFAAELRTIVDEAKARMTAVPTAARPKALPILQPRGELSGLLSVSHTKLRLPDMVLEPAILKRAQRVLREQRQRDRLKQHGLSPQRKLLLVGPPGTGKTMTAAILAGELDLPLFTIQLHALITKFMGETAAKLRLIFDAMQQSRAVYLFDEFDALGSDRGARNDVGEIRRILNSFLVFLEQDQTDSLIVAATNHPALLDRALFRRFDAVIEYSLPSAALALKVMRARLGGLDTAEVNWKAAAEGAKGLSHADVVRACEDAAKHAILDRTTRIETDTLLAALRERRPANG